MHILHVTPYYAPAYAFGGVPRAVEGMTRALVRRNHQVTVLTTDAFTLGKRLSKDLDTTINGVHVLRIPNQLYALRRWNLSTPFALRNVAKQLLPRVDAIHLHEFRTVENLLIASLQSAFDIPVILSPHGTMNLGTGRSTLKIGWDRLFSPRIAHMVTHVLALAQSELDDIQDLWSTYSNAKTRFSVIPNGLDLDEVNNLPDPQPFREKYGLGEARIILFMGRLHRRKGVEPLVRAFLQSNLPNTKLILAGPDEGMRSTIEVMIDSRVCLLGYIEGQERLQALASADLFVLPAVGEGLSMAVLEAMGAGIPVLLSPGCNFPEVATSNAGRIVEPQVESLTEALHELLTDEDALSQMGINARRLIHEQFTWDRVAEQLETIYAAKQG